MWLSFFFAVPPNYWIQSNLQRKKGKLLFLEISKKSKTTDGVAWFCFKEVRRNVLFNLFTSCFKLLLTHLSLTLRRAIITAVPFILISSNTCGKYRRSAGEFFNPLARISQMKMVDPLGCFFSLLYTSSIPWEVWICPKHFERLPAVLIQ